jgi:CDP-paratose 2-epimerase
MNRISGNAFNMGGGVKNTISLVELLELIEDVSGKKPKIIKDDWRPSDQKYYVSDFKKFANATGWSPKVNTAKGVERLYNWLSENAPVMEKGNKKRSAARHELIEEHK